jgi:hypothetical protein
MEGAVQTEGFPQRLWIVFTLIPSFVYFLALPVLSRDKHVAVMTRCNNGEISRGEAESLLGGKV